MFVVDLGFRAELASKCCFVLVVHVWKWLIVNRRKRSLLTFGISNSFAGQQLTAGDQAYEGKSGQDRGTIFKCATSTVDFLGGG